ncbi:MAG TPA: hypothetical protein DCE78_09965 [Bacteroidetes bacterium]|nr:hypothetical protein [Bacteroidota bacterium]
METSDWIQVIGILINVIFGVVIIWLVQSKLENKRVLKDYIIRETIQIRADYCKLIDKVISSQFKPQDLIIEYKLINVNGYNILAVANKKYNTDMTVLIPYQIELLRIICDDENYVKGYKTNNDVQLHPNTSNRIMKFQADNSSIFNDLIVIINDA